MEVINIYCNLQAQMEYENNNDKITMEDNNSIYPSIYMYVIMICWSMNNTPYRTTRPCSSSCKVAQLVYLAIQQASAMHQTKSLYNAVF